MGKWCLHANSFIFDQIVIKVAGNQDRHKSSDEFDFGPLVSMAHLYVFEMRFDLGTLDSGERSLPFGLLVNRVMALDRRQNFVYAQYLVNLFVDFDQILYMHWYWQDVDLDDWIIFFVYFQQSYGSWLMLKFRLYSISCGPIDGLW